MSFRPPTDASFSLNHKLFPSDWAPPENASIENMNKRHGFMANQVRLTPKVETLIRFRRHVFIEHTRLRFHFELV